MIAPELYDLVRQRAQKRCEFCGMSESDYEGEMDVAYFQPLAYAGTATPANLLYCCARCLAYKMDYWPTTPEAGALWNPRTTPAQEHFFEKDNGEWWPLTPTGAFTLQRLRLNRLPLVDHRARERVGAKELALLTRYLALLHIAESLLQQQAALQTEQRALWQEQQALLQLLESQTRKRTLGQS